MGKCINVNGNPIVANDGTGSAFRFTKRENTEGNRALMHTWWNEIVNLYGMGVQYYVHGYSLSSHDYLYGEEPTAIFSGPNPMMVLGTMENDSVILSKFGIQTNSDFTVLIPRAEYARVFGTLAEPKAGDLIRLAEFGCDRPGACGDPYSTDINGSIVQASAYPTDSDKVCEIVHDNLFSTSTAVSDVSGGIVSPSGYGCVSPYCERLNWGEIRRCPYLFEVTQRRDENVTQGYNIFMGHYIWVLYCKRFDYSYEPGAGLECGNQIVSDERKDIGLQPTDRTNPDPMQDPSPNKKYEQNVEEESDNDIWDYGKAPGNNTNPYGGY